VRGAVVGLGSLPNPVVAWTAVPDSEARPFSTSPSLLGARATVLWSRAISIDVFNRGCLPGWVPRDLACAVILRGRAGSSRCGGRGELLAARPPSAQPGRVVLPPGSAELADIGADVAPPLGQSNARDRPDGPPPKIDQPLDHRTVALHPTGRARPRIREGATSSSQRAHRIGCPQTRPSTRPQRAKRRPPARGPVAAPRGRMRRRSWCISDSPTRAAVENRANPAQPGSAERTSRVPRTHKRIFIEAVPDGSELSDPPAILEP
jgi:hypothetical protein